LARDVFFRHALLVDRCNWTGSECDLLIVTGNRYLIDVEIKISRADFNRDAKKEKWFRYPTALGDGKTRVQFPEKIWKHYFAMPAEIWNDEMMFKMPSTRSGILLLHRNADGRIRATVRERASINPDAEKLQPEQCLNIARLANMRMWNAYETLRRMKL
jgi:hypothetical protein